MAAIPGPVYGLEVPPGEVLIPANLEFPASVSILFIFSPALYSLFSSVVIEIEVNGWT
jgi:hypothetical protein